MQQLESPHSYPPEVLAELRTMPALAVDIANRWMLGWPRAVAALIESGEYLDALRRQEADERDVLSDPGNGHLARHEIIQEYGLSLSPPSASASTSDERARWQGMAARR